MQPAPIPPDESERLAALRRYDILDTPAEADFDDFTRLASQICGVPFATITLVETARQWFKSKVGLETSETPRDISFCGHAIAGSEILEVPNALEDERFLDNPLVVGEPKVRFYAGAPLVTPDGRSIGALCVLDRTPRHLTPEQREMLGVLSRQVVHLLELRLAGRKITWLNQNLERLYAEAQQARAAAEAANAAKDRFLAMLSHELRTPLSPVLHAAALLENLPCPQPIRGALEVIRRNVQLEARLIDDLLDLARIRSGKLQLQVEPVDAHDLLRCALEICESDLHTRGLRLTLDLRAKQPWLDADPARIQQIFWNLIRNAVKFTPPGGTITLRTVDDLREGSFRFEIIDSGIGLDPDRLERIFDAFEQGHNRPSGGLGLGLAICRALVALHGGRIEARSGGSGQGSSFAVTLPMGREPEATPVNAPAAPLEPAAGGLRVLLVEDHGDTAATLGRLLAHSGYAVQTAESFTAALRRLEEAEFDLLISDIGLPDGSGLNLMPIFAEGAAGRPIAGIALSGFGMPEDVARSYAVGFHEHLTKPVDFALLRKSLARVASTIPAPVPVLV